jgi:hypothetical protein
MWNGWWHAAESAVLECNDERGLFVFVFVFVVGVAPLHRCRLLIASNPVSI